MVGNVSPPFSRVKHTQKFLIGSPAKQEICLGCVSGMVCSCLTISLLSNFLRTLEENLPPSVGEV